MEWGEPTLPGFLAKRRCQSGGIHWVQRDHHRRRGVTYVGGSSLAGAGWAGWSGGVDGLTMRFPCLFLVPVLVACVSLTVMAAPEAIEIGPDNFRDLPRGKEADGIVGDFVLRNDRVELTVSHNAPLRRANMSTFYGTNGINPGCLYDLTLRGAANDQMVIFSPLAQRGSVSHVRIVRDGREGVAEVETVVAAARNEGLFKRHSYQLEDGWQGVRIVSTLRNEGSEVREGRLEDVWTRFARQGRAGEFFWADAEDPADKAGYAYAFLRDGTGPVAEAALKVAPGEEMTVTRFLAVGRSPAEAVGEVAARLGPVGRWKFRVVDEQGVVVTTARLEIPWGTNRVPAYPDAVGEGEVGMAPGEHEVVVTDMGRIPVRRTVTVRAGETTVSEMVLGSCGRLAFDVHDPTRRSLPCKVQFIGIDGTPSPDLGPVLRAHGCLDQYHSETGRFTVALPAGRYRVVVTRGIEFSHVSREITVPQAGIVPFEAELRRMVDTTGWVSADYHNHSTESGDNTCGTPDRIINLAAEHIEFAPTTEHNRLFDWRPVIQRLGLLSEVQTVPGLELTGSGAHMNSFPFTPQPGLQDNGAPVWNRDPRITALTLRRWQGEDPHRWVQINHPDMVENFFDRDLDGRVDGGFLNLAGMIDAVETENFATQDMLGDAPFRVVRGAGGQERVEFNRAFLWFQLLNRGARFWAMAVSDAHTVHGNGVGGWRMYLPSASDRPEEIDWRENVHHAKAGRSILTTGPFLHVQLADGTLPGGLSRSPQPTKLQVRIQCTDWIDIDRVQVIVNGRRPETLNFTRTKHPEKFRTGVVRFEESIALDLAEDAHVVVVAMGENSDLSVGYGSSGQARLKPCAYHNPIFIDVDGNGFTPNGDTLGFDLPAGKLSVAEAKRILEAKR